MRANYFCLEGFKTEVTMKKLSVPEQTIEKLPLYLRRSEELQEKGKDSVTSHKFVRDLPGINLIFSPRTPAPFL